jgi:hypothetical protein
VSTDDPYAEAEEVLAGYWVVECDGFDRATKIAARLTSCPGRSAEIGEELVQQLGERCGCRRDRHSVWSTGRS